ncbi:hypothetical protein E4P40_05300 [Blastococcus sp. CT_GayMR20]|uniref:hypothetical protein n=1 Tax=Blastococcus sp. CT_GayMR20 TaxID=2559609 RepID=UPI0010732AC7|nr:hypothetical protein [Blastococcus sp. CT_GayMR20]TFV91724.1 hypothetical protein E4P40_05300 [Blastococcus sp. CT_GayMR20]
MTERLQPPHGSGQKTARRRGARSRAGGPRGPRTVPADTIGEPTILGFPADVPEEGTALPQPELIVLKRPDRVAGGALVLAGVAANLSLLLSWSTGEGPTGLALLQRSVEGLGAGVAEWAGGGVWQPFVVVASGGLLVVLGLLLLVPARAHRLVGLVALVVALGCAAAVVLLLADTGWTLDRYGAGMWCAVAVPVLGLLGALKAMLTTPLVTLDAR